MVLDDGETVGRPGVSGLSDVVGQSVSSSTVSTELLLLQLDPEQLGGEVYRGAAVSPHGPPEPAD